MKNKFRFVLWALLVVILTQRIPLWWQQQQTLDLPISGVILNYQGEKHSLETNSKKIVVLWATWCAPCSAEIKRLTWLSQLGLLNPEQVWIVSNEDVELLRKTHFQRGYPFRGFVDPSGTLAQQIKAYATPTIIFINEKSEVVSLLTGLSPSLELRTLLFF